MSLRRLGIQSAVLALWIGVTSTTWGSNEKETAAPDMPPTSAPATSAAKPRDPLLDQIDEAVRATAQRRLTAGVHTPWQIVHGILAQRWELSLLADGNSKDEINAIEWIMSGVTFDGMPMWEATPYGGRGHTFTRPYAFEGHPTQFMGYMTMANIPLEYEVKTPTKTITIRDIINDAKMQVHEGVEITWTLWALAHYEEPDAQWFNAAGEPWSIERLVRLQIAEPVTSGACGGCHGLFALAYARNMYISTKKPLRGVWFEADQKVKQYIELARSMQNPDGSFSSNHFAGPGFSDDFATRIATSGHQLEWLMVALPQSKLKEEWVRRAIACVAKDLINNRHVPSDCGPLFHGMHALVIYRQRTVPGYLVPKFNSHVKLADRVGRHPAQARVPKTADRKAVSLKKPHIYESGKGTAAGEQSVARPTIANTPSDAPTATDDTPKAETPNVEIPMPVETPKGDIPTPVETPNVETPNVETPNVDGPQE